MKEFIEHLIKEIVDRPDEVQVNEISSGSVVILEVRVGDGEMGKVIGRRGQMASSLRTIAGAAAAKHGKRLVLEILESDHTGQKGERSKSRTWRKPHEKMTVDS